MQPPNDNSPMPWPVVVLWVVGALVCASALLLGVGLLLLFLMISDVLR